MQATGMEYEEEEGVDDECKFYILWNRITWLLLMNGAGEERNMIIITHQAEDSIGRRWGSRVAAQQQYY